MQQQPILYTSRLTLRPFALADAARVQKLAGDRRVSELTLNIPHPYQDGLAEQWISTHALSFARREAVVYAITLSESKELIGTVSLTQLTASDGNLGYWIGVPYWGNGYCTEAVESVVEFGVGQFGLPLIYARHLRENLPSGRVILKNGFQHMGTVSLDFNGQPRLLEHYERKA